MHPQLHGDRGWFAGRGQDLPVLRGTLLHVTVDRLPDGRDPERAMWLWHADPAPLSLDELWRAYLARFDIEHAFKTLKHLLGLTAAKVRTPEQAGRWIRLVMAAHAQLHLARPLTADLRRPWEKHPAPGRSPPEESAAGSATSAPAWAHPPVFPSPPASARFTCLTSLCRAADSGCRHLSCAGDNFRARYARNSWSPAQESRGDSPARAAERGRQRLAGTARHRGTPSVPHGNQEAPPPKKGRKTSRNVPGWQDPPYPERNRGRTSRTGNLACWNSLLLEHLDEDRARRLAEHAAFYGPDADFLKAQAARRRGDLGEARTLIAKCLKQPPGKTEFKDVAEEVGADAPDLS